MPVKAPPGKLLVAVRDRGEWLVGDMYTLQFGNNCYLRLPTEAGVITAYAPRETMVAKLQEALTMFQSPQENMATKPGRQPGCSVTNSNPHHIINYRGVPLDDIEPETMIEIFYATPSLSFVAPDFEAFILSYLNLNPDVVRVERALDVDDLFDSYGVAVRGAQSRIAEVLGISNAGSHRKRILAVLRQLANKYSTTTRKSPEKARRAA